MTRLANRSPRANPWSVAALALPMWVAMSALCSPPGAQGAEAAASDAKAATPQSFADYDATLAEHYPTLRALIVARGNCVVFEYYRKDIDAETLSPVYSVTKSVLAILVGIAIDRVTSAWIKSCRSFFQKQLTTTSIRTFATSRFVIC
jgi:CubicO group peptidase (beta-lactamase class C family)